MGKRYLRDVRALAARALANGARRVSTTQVVWEIAGNCEQPYTTAFIGYAERDAPTFRGKGPSMEVLIDTRCRKCPKCRQIRRNLWKHRIGQEAALWPRTWLGTLTCRMDVHHRFLSLARSRFSPNGDLDGETPERQFAIIEREYWSEVSLMLKRVREQLPARSIRHCAVTEVHPGGGPAHGLVHYHLLVHEVSIEHPVRHTVLNDAWPHGFSKWRLVRDVAQATYVAKYLSKDALARVRASQSYGETVSTDEPSELQLPQWGIDPLTAYLDPGQGSGSVDPSAV